MSKVGIYDIKDFSRLAGTPSAAAFIPRGSGVAELSSKSFPIAARTEELRSFDVKLDGVEVSKRCLYLVVSYLEQLKEDNPEVLNKFLSALFLSDLSTKDFSVFYGDRDLRKVADDLGYAQLGNVEQLRDWETQVEAIATQGTVVLDRGAGLDFDTSLIHNELQPETIAQMKQWYEKHQNLEKRVNQLLQARIPA